MSTNNDKYLVLRGKNKDIYFIQKRVSKKISSIIGKDFIKKSLETRDIDIAREKRDKIIKDLKDLELKYKNINFSFKKNASNDYVRTETPNLLDVNIDYEYKNKDFSSKNRNENDYVPIKKIDLPKINSTDGYFSFIDYSALPNKKDLSEFFDKIFPACLIFIVILVTLLV